MRERPNSWKLFKALSICEADVSNPILLLAIVLIKVMNIRALKQKKEGEERGRRKREKKEGKSERGKERKRESGRKEARKIGER